jgi:hypothetical protein
MRWHYPADARQSVIHWSGATSALLVPAVVEGLPGRPDKRAASASLVERLRQLDCGAAGPSVRPQQRFQLLATLPSSLHEVLATTTLQAIIATGEGGRCGPACAAVCNSVGASRECLSPGHALSRRSGGGSGGAAAGERDAPGLENLESCHAEPSGQPQPRLSVFDASAAPYNG